MIGLHIAQIWTSSSGRFSKRPYGRGRFSNYEKSTRLTASYSQQPRRSCSNDLEFYYIRYCIKFAQIYAWKSATGYQKRRFYNQFLMMIWFFYSILVFYSLASTFLKNCWRVQLFVHSVSNPSFKMENKCRIAPVFRTWTPNSNTEESTSSDALP